MPEPVVNDWLDEDTHLDTSQGPKPIVEQEQTETPATEEVVDDPTSQAFAETERPVAEVYEPVQYDFGDGATALIEKDNKGWKATLDAGTGGQPEVFKGHTKDEMYQNLMAGKINATKKIREQNRRIKLGVPDPPQQEQPAPTSARRLNADDITELKIQIQDDPDVALDNWVQKKTGFKLADLAQAAINGNAAQMELFRQQVDQSFVASVPDYYAVQDNYVAMLSWLAKYKLHKQLIPDDLGERGNIIRYGNETEILKDLFTRQAYTVATLTEAYEDLKEDGLLVFPAPPPVVEQPTRTTEEPEQVIRRPRGSLGIRSKETTNMPAPTTERVLNTKISYEDLDKLPTDEINKLMQGIQELNRDNPEAVKNALKVGREKTK